MQPSILLSLLSSAVGSAGAGEARASYFEVLYQPPPSRWPAFLVSLLIHALALLALPALLGTIDPIDQPSYWARQLQWDRSLRIRIPERLYLASGGRRAPAPKPRGGAPQATSGASRRAGGAVASRPKSTPGAGPRRRFELPALARRALHPQSVLQPELPPDLPLSANARLPELFFWAPKPPPPFRRKFMVTPGYARAPAATLRLDAPPGLESPAETAGLSPLAPPALSELRQEALAAAARLPLRVPAPPPQSELRGTTTETAAGDPLTVLSLSSSPRPLHEILLVPPANQLGTMPEGAGGPGAPKPGSAPGVRAVVRSRTSAGESAAAAEKAAEGILALSRPEIAAPLPETAITQPLPPPEELAPPPVAAAPHRPSILAENTRLEHPAAGVFDIVVQSAEADGFPESAGVLTGRPVYSVYLNVGGPRDWVLQYCIPAGEARAAEVSGGVVRLSSPSPLVAPYPRVTFRPTVKSRPGVPYVMVHGFLETNGRLDGLRVLGVHGSEDAPSILPVLQQWEFRPATQDGRPVRIEVLLAIPAQ